MDWLAVGWHPARWLILLDRRADSPSCSPCWAAVYLLLLRLRDQRPRRRRSFGQPGIVACLAAWAGAAWGGLAMVITSVSRTRSRASSDEGVAAWRRSGVGPVIPGRPDDGDGRLGRSCGLAGRGLGRGVGGGPRIHRPAGPHTGLGLDLAPDLSGHSGPITTS